MVTSVSRKVSRFGVAAYLSIATALLLVLLTAAWGAWRDIAEARRFVLDAEIVRLRSHAKRTVGRIENYLEEKRQERSVAALRDAVWLRAFWQRVVPREHQRLYAALVDENGMVVMHSDPSRQGKKLERQWFERRAWDAGDDVVETQSETLSLGRPAYDIQVPVELDGREIATYHSGFDVEWLSQEVARQRRRVYTRWMLIDGVIACIVLVAGLSLFRLARRTAALQQSLALARTQQLAELGRLAGALAHEIRNPLNAIRLNLHSLHRHLSNGSVAKREEVVTILAQSDDEVQRLERLIKSLLGYARPEAGRIEDVDVRQEVKAVAGFLDQLLTARRINLRTDLPEHSVEVHIDRDRFKQSMLNILNNAADAIGREGEISVVLEQQGGLAKLTIADTGPGIATKDRENIFEPFYTTKETGCGLGLALVRRFVDEAGGTIAVDSNGARGTVFEIRLPAVHPKGQV